MTREMQRQTADQWSRFWQSGSLTTFIGRFEDNYDGDVQAFWLLELRKLPIGARIIDLATGNGALALLATQYGRHQGKRFHVTAVDYADIDPVSFAKDSQFDEMAAIDFIANTPIEDTALDDGTFDAAISQFGFEYGDPEASVREVSRLLKPSGARFAAIMHREDSDIVTQARDGLEQVVACESSNLHASIKPVLRRLDELHRDGRNPGDDSRAEDLRAELNRKTEEMHRLQSRFRDPSMYPYYLKQSMSVFDPKIVGRMTLEEKFEHLEKVNRFTEDYKQRMQDLSAAARSEAEFDDLKAAFTREGFRIERSEAFYFETARFGHVMVASR